jgi:mono/diheme cytochrome c family protein
MKLRTKPLVSIAALLILLALLVVPGIFMGWNFYPAAWHAFIVGPRSRPLRDTQFARTPQRRERGKYLAEGVLACFRCHSDRDWNLPGAPPARGKEGAGHIFTEDGRPWLVAPNITSDSETGAGRWTDDMIARAIREGVGHDGRMLHPLMWYGAFHDLSDEDVASVVVFLRSVPPVRNSLPQTRIPLNRRLRYADLQLPITSPVPAPDLSTPQKRGEYLAGLADCVGCHTSWYHPQAPVFAKLFAGGNLLEGPNGFTIVSPNITPDPSGISYYDEHLFVEVMRSGKVKARPLHPIMPWFWYGKMTGKDLQDVFEYLRDQQPIKHSVDNAEPPTLCKLCQEKHGGGDRN